ncbi:ABC transporter substrate-binding protein [Thermodesulfobacteriota bacterium]
MNRRAKAGIWIRILIIGFLFMFGLVGSAYAEKPVYAIGNIANLTGIYAPGMRGTHEGFLDAVDAANREGKLPVELKSVWVDGASSPAKALSACKKMVSQHNPVVIIDGTTPSSLAIKGYVLKKKIPALSGGGADPLWALPSYSFSAIAPYQNQVGAWVDYYLKHLWPKKGLKRTPNFAWLTWDNAAGRASITPKVKEYIKSKGVNIMPGDGEFVPVAPTELSARMLRLKKNKVDFTYGLLLHPTAAAVLKGMGKMGMIDEIDTHFILPNPVGLVNQAGPLCRNTYSADYVWNGNDWPEKSPRIIEVFNRNDREKQKFRKTMYAVGFSWGLITIEAVRMAAQDVGANNVTGEACYKALTRLKNFKRWGLGPKITYGEKKRYALDSICYFRLNDSRINTVGEFPTPNLTKFEF